jgi:hypothetical protein
MSEAFRWDHHDFHPFTLLSIIPDSCSLECDPKHLCHIPQGSNPVEPSFFICDLCGSGTNRSKLITFERIYLLKALEPEVEVYEVFPTFASCG